MSGAPRRPSARVQFAAVFRKEVRQTVRDRRMMFMLVAAPLLQTLVFGYAVDFTVDRVPTVVVDRDGTDLSRLHARRLLADGTLREAGRTPVPGRADQDLDDGRAAVAVIFPQRFGADLLAGRSPEVQVVLDGTDPNRSVVAGAAAAQYFGGVAERMAREKLSAAGLSPPAQLALSPRIFYNPTVQSPPYMIPGIAALLLLVVTTIVTAMGLAREREMGTLEQVMVTPIRPTVLLFGKIAPYVFIGFLDVMLLVAAGTWVFGVPIRGPIGVLVTATLLYLLTTLGVGLLISTISRTQQQSFLAGFLFIMPAVLLSGVVSPIRAMPAWLRAVTWVNPVRHFAEVMRSCLLRGAGFGDVAVPLAALAAVGGVVFALAVVRFRTRLG
ncbi:MAG TPA: ABC transporter permease [Anaeromyxobacter sp.]|nr:ABC transporter permease [Anaeromyxobacter sp.]